MSHAEVDNPHPTFAMNLQGKTPLVTGSTSGIGLGIAQ